MSHLKMIFKFIYSLIKNKTVVINCIALLCLASSFAQKHSLKFTHYSKQDGLNQSSVNFVFQDSDDFLWIANFGGINRFDGYNFKSYTNTFSDDTSIPDNSVWYIYERSDKSLWFGTKAGLSKYNKTEDNFINYFIHEKNPASGTLAIKALFEDSKGQFYIGSEGEGLFLFSEQNGEFNRVSILPDDLKVSAITEDKNNNLWVATENKGIFKIDKDRKSAIDFSDTNAFSSQTIWSLFADNSGNVWIGTDNDGLVKYEATTERFILLKNDSRNSNYDSGNKIKTIAADKNQGLWVGSATKGLSQYSFKENKFFTYKVDPYDVNSLHDSDVSSIFPGTNNVLYVGFYTKGFDKIITTPFSTLKNNPKNPNSLPNNNVYCMFNDSNGILWFGTFGGGLSSYNPKSGKFSHFKHDENNSTSISHDWVRIIYEDSKSVMWIGTWGGGLNKFDRITGRFTRYLPNLNNPNSINHNIITAVFEDSSGVIWIGSYGGGINIYQPETDDFMSITADKNNPNSLSDDHITSFFEDDGLIWICTYGGGLNSFDKKNKKFTNYLPDTKNEFSLNNHKTLHIYKEKDSSFFWITTLGGGLNKFYYKENTFYNYTENDGLANNSTMGMLKDSEGTYWISSNNGISRFNPQEETFMNFTSKDGLGSDDYNLEAYAKSDDGLFYFGGKNGVTYFDPKSVELTANFPKIQITNLKVEDSSFVSLPEIIRANYKDRIILDFAAVNADISKNIDYSYQLIGQDNSWRDINEIRHLEFTSLSPGDYQLRLKSTNSNKVWNSNFKEIGIEITPPWYMSWYFRIGAILAIILGAVSYYKIQIDKARRQTRLLEIKVKERTKTIEESKLALEKQAEVISKQNYELQDLNELKDRILSILSHDIKTPLNSLNTIVSVFKIDDLIKDKESLQEYMSIVKTELGKVRSLLDNILLWAKYQITNVAIQTENVSVYSIAEEIHQLYEEKVKEKQLELINELDKTEIIEADRNVLSFILRNLHANAIKFTPEQGKIVVSSKIENQQFVISVKDSGVGMNDESMNKLFNEKQISWQLGTDGETGTGLGLILCKEFAEKHGGTMSVASELGKGSTFSFSFPLTSVPASSQ